MTNSDGRIQFPFTRDSMPEGTYKLLFKVGDYYKMHDKETLYPYVEVRALLFIMHFVAYNIFKLNRAL